MQNKTPHAVLITSKNECFHCSEQCEWRVLCVIVITFSLSGIQSSTEQVTYVFLKTDFHKDKCWCWQQISKKGGVSRSVFLVKLRSTPQVSWREKKNKILERQKLTRSEGWKKKALNKKSVKLLMEAWLNLCGWFSLSRL